LVMPMLSCRFMAVSSVRRERDHTMAVCRAVHG
jgi:hypothetical protein